MENDPQTMDGYLLGVLDLSPVPVFILLPLMKTKIRLSESSENIQLIIDLMQTENNPN